MSGKYLKVSEKFLKMKKRVFRISEMEGIGENIWKKKF